MGPHLHVANALLISGRIHEGILPYSSAVLVAFLEFLCAKFRAQVPAKYELRAVGAAREAGQRNKKPPKNRTRLGFFGGGEGSEPRVISSSPAPCRLSTLVRQVSGKLIPLRGTVSRSAANVSGTLTRFAGKASAHFLVRFEDLERQVRRASFKLSIRARGAVDTGEDVAKLNGDALKLRHGGVVAEVFHGVHYTLVWSVCREKSGKSDQKS